MPGKTDIFELMLADHRRIDRLQAALRDAAAPASAPAPRLASTWNRLAGLITEHVRDAQQVCWPAICGPGPQADSQMRELAADAEDLAGAIAAARLLPTGSPSWWSAVSSVLRCCARLLRREEHLLTGFATRASRAQRDQLGRQWLTCRTTPPTAAGPGKRRLPASLNVT